MGRKNRRAKYEYRQHLGFDPRKYIQRNIQVERPQQESQKFQAFGRTDSADSTDSTYSMRNAYTEEAESHPYRTPYRGEIWFANLGYHPGTSVQDGCRPVLIISNDKGNHFASTIVVLPMTIRMKKCSLPSHVELRQEDLSKANLNRPFEESLLLAEQITTIGKSALRSYIGKVEAPEKLAEIEHAVKAQLGMKAV